MCCTIVGIVELVHTLVTCVPPDPSVVSDSGCVTGAAQHVGIPFGSWGDGCPISMHEFHCTVLIFKNAILLMIVGCTDAVLFLYPAHLRL